MFNCVFVTFLCGILGQVWYLIVSIHGLCRLSYFHSSNGSELFGCLPFDGENVNRFYDVISSAEMPCYIFIQVIVRGC